MKNKSIILIIALFVSINLISQDIPDKIFLNSKPYIGTWIANNGNMSYKIVFESYSSKVSLIDNKSITVESFVGSIQYIQDGKIIRDVKVDENTPLSPRNEENNIAILRYDDKEKRWGARVTFRIDNNNKNKAYWSYTPEYLRSGDNKTPIDIPTTLIFYKQ